MAAAAATYTKTGAKASKKTTLPKEVFAVESNDHTVLHQAYRAYLAAGRSTGAQTLTRGLVRGGGRKPWRQKGTGAARAGSRRQPNWRGGGVVFGPTGDENYAIRISKKAKRLALRQALSAKAASGSVCVLEDFDIKNGTVKEAKKVLDKLEAGRNKLLIVEHKTDVIDRATRNLPDVTATAAQYLNIAKILHADTVIITKPALDVIKTWLAVGESKQAAGSPKGGSK